MLSVCQFEKLLTQLVKLFYCIQLFPHIMYCQGQPELQVQLKAELALISLNPATSFFKQMVDLFLLGK